MVLNFDEDRVAMLSPCDMVEKIEGMPETVVTFFDDKIMDEFLRLYKVETIGSTAIKKHTIYKTVINGKEIAVVLAGIGAPLSVALFEEVCFMGAKNILMFGSCGVLTDIKEASIIIPYAAVRDEGTSFHYAPAGEEIQLNPVYVDRLEKLCKEAEVDYVKGKTWTNDAFYRETKAKVAQRVKEGCICVEMECSAMAAFANLRNVNFAQFFYAADSLAKEKWDMRILQGESLQGEEIALKLALEFATKLFD